MRQKVLITGAAGFVGKATVSEFVKEGWLVRAAVRSHRDITAAKSPSIEYISVGDIAEVNDWTEYCIGCSVVVHLAARAHKAIDTPSDAKLFERDNSYATIAIAEGASKSGVKRFIYISSAGVMGDFSDRPFTEVDTPNPISEYAKSKLKAESLLTLLRSRSAMEVTILRPTLIYGLGNPGNLERLLKLLKTGFPLPFANVSGKRSLLNVSKFAEIIFTTATHPAAPGRVFLVSDGEDLSTIQLIRSLAVSIGQRANLFKFPVSILRTSASMIGKGREIDKILGSFQVDSSYLREELGIDRLSTRSYLERNRIL